MAYSDLSLEFNMLDLQTVLRSFLTRQAFFPHPSEVRKELQSMAKRKEAEAVENLPKLGCEECRDEPFGPGTKLGVDPAGNRCVYQCRCKVARDEAKKPPAGEHEDGKAAAAGAR